MPDSFFRPLPSLSTAPPSPVDGEAYYNTATAEIQFRENGVWAGLGADAQPVSATDRPNFANVQITHSDLTYAASVVVNFDGNGFQTVSLAGGIEFTTSNLAAGRSKTIRIICDGTAQSLTFPAGWKFLGAAAPATLAASKVAVLTLISFGTTDSDVIAAYSAEP